MTIQSAFLPPIAYGRHKPSPDAVLEDLPFGAKVSAELLTWLSSLPSDTQTQEIYIASSWRNLSWTALNLYLSELVSETEIEIGMAGHSERVSQLAVRCGVALGLQPVALSELFWGGALHDIGKMVLERHVLSKSSALSTQDWQLVREHPVWGYDTLMQVLNNRAVAEIALTHHEHWDGKGYPTGIGGNTIPAYGRIVAVVDTFDALTTPRPYKQAVSEDTALSILLDEAGRQFDPGLVRQLVDGNVLRQRDLMNRPDLG